MRMRNAQMRRHWPWLLTALTLVALVAVAVFSFSGRYFHEGATGWRAALRDASPLGLAVSAAVVAVAGTIGRAVRPPRYWDILNRLLTAYRGIFFKQEIQSGAEDDDHRLTLFRSVHWCWRRWPPWSRRLVPVARSGESTQRSDSVFRIPDKSLDAEGVAGKAFYVENFLRVSGLPDLRAGTVAEDAWQAYADNTHCDTAFLKRSPPPPRARSYIGFLVRVRGKRWGTVVIDSSNVTTDGLSDDVLGQLRTALGIVLE